METLRLRIRALALMLVLTAGVWLHPFAHSPSAASPQGQSVAVNGIQLYYETHGDGEPLVLLHGFTGSVKTWEKFIPAFEKKYKVIAVDLRGHGRSTNPSKEFTHRQAARDVLALLDTLKLQKIKAIGISSGGMTLIHMATTEPSRIEAMILIGATVYFPEQAREIMRRRTPDSITPGEFERMRRHHLLGDEQIRALREQFHRFKDSYDDMNFTGPYLSTIRARTLIIHGDRDEFFPVNIPVEMYRAIPRSSLWIVPNGGHVPINDPSVPFVPIAEEFLAGGPEKGQ